MKTMAMLFLFLLFNSGLALSQPEAGSKELSISAAFGSYSSSYKGPYISVETEAKTYLLAAFRAGFYITKAFEIEPEINMLLQEEGSIILGVNGAYNFDITNSIVHPFITVGAGLGNGITMLNLPVRSSDDFNIFNYNMGAGIKIMINENVASRFEYRYRHFSYEKSGYDITYSTHNVLFGFSIFL